MRVASLLLCFNIEVPSALLKKIRSLFRFIISTTGPEEQSGYGLELTFRLKRQPGDTSPPMWPASLMNSLARYIFQTGEYYSKIIYH